MRRGIFVVGVLTLGIGVVAVPSAAADTYVPCETPRLIKAIEDANASGAPVRLILAGRCTYRVDRPIGDNGFPVVTGNVELVGDDTTITRHPAAPRFRFFQVAGGAKLTLEGLTLTGGHTPDGVAPGGSGAGGGAVHSRGELLISRSTLSGNRTGDGAAGGAGSVDGGRGGSGGAVYSEGTALRVSKSVLKGNVTGNGGWGAAGGRGKDNSAVPEERDGIRGGLGGHGGAGGAIANYAGVFELLLSSVDDNRTGSGGPGGDSGRGGDNTNGPGGNGGGPIRGGDGGNGGAVYTSDQVNVHGSSASGNVTGDGGPGGRAGDGGNGEVGGNGGGRLNKFRSGSGGNGGFGGALFIDRDLGRAVVLFSFTAENNRTGNGGDGGRGGDGGVPEGRAGDGAYGGHGGSGGAIHLARTVTRSFTATHTDFIGNTTGNGRAGGTGGFGARQGQGAGGGDGGSGGGVFFETRNAGAFDMTTFQRNVTGKGGPGGRSHAPDVPDGSTGHTGAGGGLAVQNNVTVTLKDVLFIENQPSACNGVPHC